MQSGGSAGGLADDVALDLVLVDELEDVRCVDEDGRRAGDGHRHEDTQLQTVNDHRDVPPVVQYLQYTHTHTHRCPSPPHRPNERGNNLLVSPTAAFSLGYLFISYIGKYLLLCLYSNVVINVIAITVPHSWSDAIQLVCSL